MYISSFPIFRGLFHIWWFFCDILGIIYYWKEQTYVEWFPCKCVCLFVHVMFNGDIFFAGVCWLSDGMMQPSARKRARIDCIIHCSDDDSDALVSTQDLDSWNTLLRAAEIRQHDPVLEAAKGLEEGGIPHIHYHRKCRSLFTMKKSLDSILAKGVKIESASVDPRRRFIRRSGWRLRYESRWEGSDPGGRVHLHGYGELAAVVLGCTNSP